jgi:hypothetical protein
VGVAAAELDSAAALNPVEQPAGVVDAGVGAHQVKDGQGVVGQVVGQSDRAGEGVGVDEAGPAIAEMGGKVQQGSDAAGGAYGGIQLHEDAVRQLARERSEGRVPMRFNHDLTRPLSAITVAAGVEQTEDGHLAAWVEFDVVWVLGRLCGWADQVTGAR